MPKTFTARSPYRGDDDPTRGRSALLSLLAAGQDHLDPDRYLLVMRGKSRVIYRLHLI